jgi:uncharacterized protein YkwD
MPAMRWAGDAFTRRKGAGIAFATACAVLGVSGPSGVVAARAAGSAVPVTRSRTWSAGATTTTSHCSTTTASGRCRGALTLPTRSNLTLIDSAVTCLIDRERAHYRLPTLQPNPELHGIASSLAREMARAGYFGDDSVAGQTPWQRITESPYAVGAQVVAVAQNIGWGTGGLATPQGVVEEWMRSTPHRLIMLSGGYRDFGVGAAPIAPSSLTHEKPGATYTVEFAARG